MAVVRAYLLDRAANGVLLQDPLGFRRGISQAVLHCAVGKRLVAEVEQLLSRIGMPLATVAGEPGQQLRNREVQHRVLLRELRALRLELDDGRRLLSEQRVTGVHVVR